MKSLYDDIVDRYKKRTINSQKNYERACKSLAGGETRSVSMYNPYPLTIAEGKGSKIFDADGNTYIDFLNNYTSLIHGHAHPDITNAIIEAAKKGTAAPMGIEEQVILGEMLVNRVPGVDKVRFCNSGTEATMFALRAARAFTGKDGIVKAIGGYHGTTDPFEYSVAPSLENSDMREDCLSVPDTKGLSYHTGLDVYAVTYNNLMQMEEVLKTYKDKIGAVILEPFLGAGGVIPATTEYLKGVRRLTKEYGVLLIFDEVQSLRLSVGGAQEKYGVIPDITAMAKIIGGGLPVGAFGGREEIMNVFDTRGHVRLSQSGTFNGNRVTMAAGIEALRLFDENACIELEAKASFFQKELEIQIKNTGLKACVTRAGSIMNIHFMEFAPNHYKESLASNKEMIRLLHLMLLEKGIYIAPRGMMVLSTVMTLEDLRTAGKAFYEVCQEIKTAM